MKKLILSITISLLTTTGVIAQYGASNNKKYLNEEPKFLFSYGLSFGAIKSKSTSIVKTHDFTSMLSLELGGLTEKGGFSVRGFYQIAPNDAHPGPYDIANSKQWPTHIITHQEKFRENASSIIMFDYHRLIDVQNDVFLTLSVGRLTHKTINHHYNHYASTNINWSYYVPAGKSVEITKHNIFGVGLYKTYSYSNYGKRYLIGADIQLGHLTQINIKHGMVF